MIKKSLSGTLLIFGFLLFYSRANAQADGPLGARAAALGNASVTLTDVWALHQNVAGIAGIDKPQAGVHAENRFSELAFTTVALHAIYPTTEYGTYGLSISRFGDALFSQQHVGLGIGHKLGQFSLGAKADVWQVAVKENGSQKAVAFSAGVQGEVIPGLYFGAYAYNLNQARLASFEDERLPTIMKAGFSYRPTSRLLLAAETEKNIDHNADFKAGAEYALLQEKFVLRSGFSTLTRKATFGAGFKARQLQVDYALGSTTLLGLSQYLSITYQIAAIRNE
ncbi:PorV/PorQ family protein [Pontibacter brevis]